MDKTNSRGVLMKTKGLLVFDVDGVLLKSDVLYCDIAKVCFSHYVSEADMGPNVTKGGQALFDTVVGRKAEQVDIEKFRAAQISNFDPKRHLYNDIEETLSKLMRNNWLAIVSNKPENIINTILHKAKLKDYFIAVVGLDSGFTPKPAPDGINHIKTLCKYDRLVYVGDAYSDFVAAQSAGAEFIYCKYGFDFEPYDYELSFEKFKNLQNLLF
jgi:HAD superfamily hydrolase (TIGR01549 family)